LAQVTALPSAALRPPLVQFQTGQDDNPSNLTPLQAPAAVYLANLAPVTRTSNRGRLETLADLFMPGSDAVTFPWHKVRYEHCVQVRSILASRYHYQTANNYLYVLRGILRECWRLGLMSTDAYHRAVAVAPIKGTSLPAGRYVTPEEWERFFRNLVEDRTPLGARDLAMFAVLRATGIRKSELLGMEVDDYNPRDMTFTVTGKGNKQREVAADEWIRPLLEMWLRIRGPRPGALFCAVYRNGHIDPEHKNLSPSNLHVVLYRRIAEAGIQKFSLHDFRRNMATDLFDADVHIKTIMDQGGWERAETAMRYDRRPKSRMKAAVAHVRNPLGGGAE
jgi:integrase/recombinase XerD